MIKSTIRDLNIDAFRGLKNLELNDLARINFLVGANNSGKTSVLEAVYLADAPCSAYTWAGLIENRESYPSDSLRWLFHQEYDEYQASFIPSPIQIRSSDFTIECALSKYLGEWTSKSSKAEMIKYEQYAITRKIDRLERQINEKIRQVGLFETPEVEKTKLLLNIENYQKRYFDLEQELSALKDYETKPQEVYRVDIHEIRNSESRETGFEFTEEDVNFLNLDNSEILDQPLFKRRNQESGSKVAFVKAALGRNHLKQRRVLSQIIAANRKQEMINVLQLFSEDIIDIEILTPTGRAPYLYFKHRNGSYYPLSTYGDGIQHVLNLALGLLKSENGFLLIDEIETGLHTSILQTVFLWLLRTAKMLNNQIFITTHSLEALDALLSVCDFGDALSEIAVYRLEKTEDATKAFRYSGDEYKSTRHDFGLDIR